MRFGLVAGSSKRVEFSLYTLNPKFSEIQSTVKNMFNYLNDISFCAFYLQVEEQLSAIE